ncbi:hypothetical protein [Deinococcus sp. DB0503]|uniref:hypothetical protein n=1 Tax=Deinococcus sp. DB0503 TaxID=2479203 RepID=UPI0018DFC3BE|nr:hypothetical protein [Deinococcus sp. DB0503]
MNRASTLFLLAALAVGTAGAQDLSAYRTLAGSLEAAAQARPKSAERALAELDRAEAAYAQLAPTLQNKQLLGGLRDTLDSARAALARTPAELQAQVLLARGLMRKALYNQTLTQLAHTPPDLSPAAGTAQMKLLAQDFGLTGAPAAALLQDAQAGHLERVAWRLQRAAAQKVSGALQATPAQRSPEAYLKLAQATSWFTVVQDAGASGLNVAQFEGALRQLTDGDLPALTASLKTLRQGAAALNQAFAAPPTVARSATQTSSPSPAQPSTTPVAAAPAQAPVAATASGGMTASGGVDVAYAALGRALTAAGHSDPETARAELVRVSAALATFPAALRTTAGYETFVRDLSATQERRGLRPGDVQALIAELGGLERSLAGGGRSTVDVLSAAVARTFNGGLRAVVFLLLALLGLVPLYLLNLAFGGRNPYWRAITAALALLLLPVFLEGVFGFLGWVGDLSGLALLRAAPSLTLWQGVYGLPLRALFTALAIGLAAYGFRGLCVQFGLLGRSSAGSMTAQPSLDWDEEPT